MVAEELYILKHKDLDVAMVTARRENCGNYRTKN